MIVIGLGMFAFLAGDFFSSMNGGASGSNIVGEVGGTTIDIQEFNNRVETSFNNQRQSNPNINIDQVRSSVWNQIVRDEIFNKEFEKLGLVVGSDEIFDMIQGENVYPTIQQTFINPETGEFDRGRLLQYLKEDIDNDETGDARARWAQFEKAIIKERLTSKYNSLIAKTLFVSNWESEINANFINETRNVSYISIPFKTIADSLVKVSDSELLAYMKSNSDDYKQEASRDIEYVVFDVNPSADDRIAAQNWINDIKADFANTKDDQNFVNKNSDAPLTNLTFVKKDALNKETESLFDAAVGTVIGPFEQGRNKFRLAKLVETQNRPDSVKARHILLSTPDAMERIDSIKNLIENGASFAKLAKDLSEDTQSALEGGNLGWFAEGRMVAEFNEVCFSANKGDLETVVTQFGVHLIEVVSKSKLSKKVKVALLDRDVLPSNQTYQTVYTQAGKFAAENDNDEEFNESSVNQNLTKRIADNLTSNSTVIAGLQNSRPLIKWANEASLGTVSQVFEFDNKFVVATLVKIRKEGLQDVDEVRAQVETIVRNQKIGEMLLDQLFEASNLQTISTEYGVDVNTVNDISFSTTQVPVLGQEPSFVGACFSVDQGQTTKPFLGKSSLFVVNVDKVNESNAENLVSPESLLSTLRNKTNFQIYQSLEALTDIEDNRSLFY